MFGSSGFGSTTSTFGGAGTFGAVTSTAGGGGSLFGQPAQQQQQQTTSLFGGVGGNTSFGSPQTSLSAFGGQQNTSSVFGQQAKPATGMFGTSTAISNSPFSAQQTQQSAAGTSVPFNAINGTDTMVKNGVATQINTRHQCVTCMKEYENKSLEELRFEDYQLNRKGPSSANTGLFGAGGTTATPQQQQNTGGLFGFGGGATATSTLGAPSAFGQTSAFGQPAQTSTAGGGGLFGSLSQQQQAKPGGLFGTTATSTTTTAGFGGGSSLGFSFNNPNSQQPQQQTNMFGQTNNNPATSTAGFAFGQPQQQQQQGMGLFGQKTLTTPVSVAPTFGSGGAFGSTTANTGLNKSLFGSTAAPPTFGTPASTAGTFGTGSLFSTNAQQQQQQQQQANKPFSFSTPFSSTPQQTSQPSTFGTNTTSTFNFSNPLSTATSSAGTGTTSAFGAPLSFSLGGNTQQQQKPLTGTTGSMFGTGLFSSGTNTNMTGTGLSLFSSGGGTNTFGSGGLNFQSNQQMQQQQQQQQQQFAQGSISFATTPFKDNQLFYNLISHRKIEDLTKPTNPLAQREYLQASSASRRKTTGGLSSSSSAFNISMTPAVKNLTYTSSTKNSNITKFRIFNGFEDEDYGVGIDVLSPKTNVKKLVLNNSDIICSTPSSGSGSRENGSIGMARRSSLLGSNSPSASNRLGLESPLAQNRRNRLTLNSSLNASDLCYVSPESGGKYGEPNRTIDFGDSINYGFGPSSMLVNQSLNHSGSSDGGDGGFNGSCLSGAGGGLSSKRGSEIDIGSGSFFNGSGGGGARTSAGGSGGLPGSVCGVVCSRPHYYLKPSLEELDRMMDSNGKCFVKGLEIGRMNFGRIKYIIPVNVANINIDEIVQFRHKEVTVYPDDKNKPELGNGLNAPAEIELDRVWPIDKSTNELIRNPEEIQKMDYEAKLRKACLRTGSEFISYSREHGVWKFKVPHFSKYSCDVEEDEEPAPTAGANQQKGLGGIPQQKLQQQRSSMSLASGGLGMGGQAPGPSGDMGTVGSAGIMPPPLIQQQKDLFEGGQPPASDVELNPLTSCDSDDDDDDLDGDDDDDELDGEDDDLDDDDFLVRRPSLKRSLQQPPESEQEHATSLPKYKPILKDYGTEKSKLLKSVMSIDEYDDRRDPTLMSIFDSQPPSKMSRPPMSMALSRIAADPEDGKRLKNRLSMIQGPSSSQITVKAPAPTIRPVEPVQFSEEPIQDLFISLRPNQVTTAIRLQGSSKVCFLPNGQFITVTQTTTRKTGKFNGQVKINQLTSYADKQELAPLSKSYRNVLEKQMKNRLNKEGVLFKEHLQSLREEIRNCQVSQVKKKLESELIIWDLCDILWPGELELEEDFLEDDGFLLGQRKKLGEWMRKNAALLFGGEFDGKDKTVLGLLKKGLVEAACDAALQEDNLWLSVVLGTCPHLLLNFEDEALDVFEGMPKDSSDIFALVSGNLKELSWLNAEKVRGMTTYDWLQHFALFIWFQGPAKTQLPVSVEKAVREFEEIMREIAEDDECPLPEAESSSVANLAVHLLKLYSCTGYPMNIVLTPRTWTKDCLDYKLDWLLMRDLEEIGYSPGDDLYKEICLGFTGMLEGIGMWKWCQFVMGHLPGPECEADNEDDPEQQEREKLAREAFCERLLERYIGEGLKDEEQFLLSSLGVPESLIYSIKCWKSSLGCRRRPDEMMWYLGIMNRWQESYDVFTNYLETGMSLDLIGKRVPAQATSIQKHLAELERNRNRIHGWEIHGKMMSSYLKMLGPQEDLEATEAAVISFMESVIKFKPVNTHQCAFLLDMTLSAQKVIQLLLAEPEIPAERRSRIEDNLVPFLEINVPKEYFDGLRCFINFTMINNATQPFRLLEFMEMERDDEIDIGDDEEQEMRT